MLEAIDHCLPFQPKRSIILIPHHVCHIRRRPAKCLCWAYRAYRLLAPTMRDPVVLPSAVRRSLPWKI